MSCDAYAIARYVAHYRAKNGYAPRPGLLCCSADEVEALVRNGVIEICPLYEGGPPVCVVLTDKGRRMSGGRG